MAESPYAPPKAQVADVAVEERGPRPGQITAALWLLYGSLAVGALHFVADPAMSSALETNPIAVLIGATVSVAVTAVLVWFLGSGHNWARIVLLILIAIGLVMMLVEEGPQKPSLATLVDVVQTLMQAGGLVLAFLPPGAAWFRRRG
jgi:hypothetical protein